MNLKSIVSKLTTRFPLRLAEKWDNVGLLLEPTSFSKGKNVEKILLTIDLTERVLEEAISNNVNMIIAYHPPIFVPFKRLTQGGAKDRIVIQCIENQIAIYSPHTTVDSAKGGVNDWLASGLGETESVSVLHPSFYQDPKQSMKVVVFVPEANVDQLRDALGKVSGVGTIGNYNNCSFAIPGTGSFKGNENSNPVVGKKLELERVSEVRLEMVCSKSSLAEISSVIQKNHPYETPAWEVHNLESTPEEGTGIGRLATLKEKIPLNVLIERIKKHLGLTAVRLALASNVDSKENSQVRTIAMCAGSGGEVLKGVKADVFWTGEMSHHEVLAANASGTSVILCEHTNTERGYLKSLKEELETMFENKTIIQLSKEDADPLVVV